MRSSYVAEVDPLTKRGHLRRQIVARSVRYHIDDYGASWMMYRVRSITRHIGRCLDAH